MHQRRNHVLPFIAAILGTAIAFADNPGPPGDPVPPGAPAAYAFTVYESPETTYDGYTLSVNVDAAADTPADLTLYVWDHDEYVPTATNTIGPTESNITVVVNARQYFGKAYFYWKITDIASPQPVLFYGPTEFVPITL